MLSSTTQIVLNCFICISGFLPSNPHRLINTSKRKIIFLHCWNSIKKQTPLLSLLLSKQSKSYKAWYLPPTNNQAKMNHYKISKRGLNIIHIFKSKTSTHLSEFFSTPASIPPYKFPSLFNLKIIERNCTWHPINSPVFFHDFEFTRTYCLKF